MSVFRNLVVFVVFFLISTIINFVIADIRHECLRPCTGEASSKKVCQYKFFVSELPTTNSICNESKVKDDVPKCRNRISVGRFLGINGSSPGPPIEVCLGDTIEILLYNKLGSEELSLHWHGLRQKDSIYMDGVPMVTQCPVLPFSNFQYRVKPEATGTYFYRAHSGALSNDLPKVYVVIQRNVTKWEDYVVRLKAKVIEMTFYFSHEYGDGVYGSLTVRGPQDDPTLERILLLSSRPPTPLTSRLHSYPPTPRELLVNGQRNGTVLEVTHGTQYLLRLINVNVHDCPVLLSTSGHAFRVQATDGNMVQPMIASQAVLFPGERLDVVLKADQRPAKYLVAIVGLRDCRNIKHDAHILYEGINMDSELIKTSEITEVRNYAFAEKGHNCKEAPNSLVCTLDLKSFQETSTEEHVQDIIYVPFDVNSFPSFTDEMTDNSYTIYESVFYPAYLSVEPGEVKIAQINGVSFKYPSSPILSQPENIREESVCSLDELSAQCADTPLFCECIQIIEVPAKRFVEIILIDEGFGGNASHTFHIHGYNASIMGYGSFVRSITKQEIMLLNRKGKLKRNIQDPPRKDSFVIPNKGYIILRFYTDNPGYWLWEARSSAVSPGISGPGMQFLMRVGTRESLPPIPPNFPTCGNNKGPDMLFEES